MGSEARPGGAEGWRGFLALIEDLSDDEQTELIAALGRDESWGTDTDFFATWAHGGQIAPDACADGSPWSVWVLKAGRGFGKTRAGAQWIVDAVAAAADAPGPPLAIALVGATLDEARSVMVEGRSGLLAVADAWLRDWNPSLRRLTFTTGATATLFSGASPEQLRGPEHHFAWCDELAKWEKPGETWDMLQLGLRLGALPRTLVTTTPRPGPHLQRIMDEPGTVVTHGTSWANPHTSDAWKRANAARYAGTRMALQELEGEMLTDTPGALWSAELLERCRLLPGTGRGTDRTAVEGGSCHVMSPLRQPAAATSPPRGGSIRPPFIRLVIAVDPPSGDGTCGIVACAKDAAGRAHILADHSVTAATPEAWSAAVAAAAEAHAPSLRSGRPLAVAESNQGGEMIRAVLRTADPDLRVKLVHARHGKAERASPVAILFEAGKVILHGRFPDLEAQLRGMIAGGGYDGPGKSPDRADAMVWGLTELMLKPEPPMPSVRRL